MRFTQVDAFTAQPFTGNPAAVLVLDEEPDAGWMALVAREMNLSETAFAVRRGGASFGLRWFTPTTEVPLCGHATLATAHVLFEEAAIGPDETITFATASGELTCRRGDDDRIVMVFPADPPVEVPDATEELSELLGAPVRWAGHGREWWLAVLDDAVTVRELAPDLVRLGGLDLDGVIVTAAADDDEPVDVVSRVFAPRIGIPEDPVTGSAHTVLGPWWAERLDRHTLVGFQASARGGVVHMRVAGGSVELAGDAVTVARGELTVGAVGSVG